MAGAVKVDKSELDILIGSLDADTLSAAPRRKFRKGVAELHREIVKTSPVDTGYYRAGWTLEINPEANQAVISNPVDYASHLILGTRKIAESQGIMASAAAYHTGGAISSSRRYPRADLSRGILHDVRAIFFEWKERFLHDMEAR